MLNSTLCKYKDVEIIAGAVCRDHVHLSVAIPPKMSVSSFMGYLKGSKRSIVRTFQLLQFFEIIDPTSKKSVSASKEGV